MGSISAGILGQYWRRDGTNRVDRQARPPCKQPALRLRLVDVGRGVGDKKLEGSFRIPLVLAQLEETFIGESIPNGKSADFRLVDGKLRLGFIVEDVKLMEGASTRHDKGNGDDALC
jgi:hypothetical protein